MLTILTLIPIIALLLCLIVFKLSVTKSGAIAMGLALVLAVVFFGITGYGLLNASGKALWVALFVSLIVWSALFLYHLVSGFGAIEVITAGLTSVLKDKFVALMILAWLFTGLLQGMAGFGIPSVIVAPILVVLGFSPVKSVCAALIGHSWSITFGSMGTSFYVIQGITGIPESELGFPVWLFNTVTILLTGIGVCFVCGGINGEHGIKKGLPYLIPTAAVMSAAQYLTIHLGMYSLGTINTALAGIITMYALYRIRNRNTAQSVASENHKNLPENTHENPENSHEKPETIQNPKKPALSIISSVFPYALILILSLLFQFIPVEVRNAVAIAPNFPATATTANPPYEVEAINDYNPIRLFVHPALVLLLASLAAFIIYKKAGIWDGAKLKDAASKTVKKGIPATLALLSFGHMSLIMMDSGMMERLAKAVAAITGKLYPLFAPYIGVLGAFLTGNNTNSSVMFGKFQQTVAAELGMNPAVMSAAQVIAGALGCSIAPTLILMAALATKQTDKVSVILKKLIPTALVIAAVMGVVNMVVIRQM